MIELYWILEIRKNKVLKVLTELRDEVSRVFDDSCYTKEQLGADNVERPILLYEVEKEIVKKALNEYIDKLKSEQIGR